MTEWTKLSSWNLRIFLASMPSFEALKHITLADPQDLKNISFCVPMNTVESRALTHVIIGKSTFP